MKKVFVCHTFQCMTNEYHASEAKAFFEKNGFELCIAPEEADVIVVSTCGFDRCRQEESMRRINGYAEEYGGKKQIVVTGCMPKIREELNKKKGIIAIGPKEMEKFNEVFAPRVPIQDIPVDTVNRHLGAKSYHIQISKGCVNRCSYCVIKKAKGFVQSRPVEEVVRDFQKGLGLGYTRFMLLADDCGSYGVDIKTDCAELLNSMVAASPKPFLIDLHYIEPGRLIRLFPKMEKEVLRRFGYINIPLESVSPKVLAAMHRSYDVEKVLRIAKVIKDLSPNVMLETHIMYGFPGETREDFLRTFSLSKYFDKVIYLLYSRNEGTPAAALPGTVSRQEATIRTRLVYEMMQKDDHFWLLGAGDGGSKGSLDIVDENIA